MKQELALTSTPKDHAKQARLLSNLGKMFLDRYHRKGNIEDLEAGIVKEEPAGFNTTIE